MESGLIVEEFNIEELSDDELASKLNSLGFTPGPIVATTRRVYQQKLAKLLGNEGIDNESDLEVMPTPLLNSTLNNVSSDSSSSPYRYDDLRRRPLQRVEGDSFDDGQQPVLSPFKPWCIEDITTQVSEPISDGTPTSNLSLTIKFIGIISLLSFAFLVYYNMESNPTNPFLQKSDLGV